MTRRKPPSLSSQDAQLWRRFTADVKPLDGRPLASAARRPKSIEVRDRPVRLEDFKAPRVVQDPQTTPLDRSWQKKLRRGRLEVDHSVDLHGMIQDAAHAQLMRALEQALLRGYRSILVITGKGKADVSDRPRGVLRQQLPKWVRESRYAPHILAIRAAHPTHGGDGAYYVLIRRRR